ncbi:bone morphogenetic protein receptor type-2 isoform X2 [Schistocerca serialis cubense]|uniref:bone morphogenetic protein receptor type-2 isoform X2 n=1 Tax=Schistocerca serialis cubense TaxID=2023355 RepID=UPI00214E75ED|nr:bone morphogenetic protein receptor type-2 isoform X2 [Schistocerca serialis cubense]
MEEAISVVNKMGIITTAVALLVLNYAKGHQVYESRICAEKNVQMHHAPDSHEYLSTFKAEENSTHTNKTCERSTNFCYAYWETNGTAVTFIKQGCWEVSGKSDCIQTKCIADKPSAARNNSRFCCCSGNLCNVNFIDDYVMPTEDITTALSRATSLMEPADDGYRTILIALVCGLVLVLISVGVGVIVLWKIHEASIYKQTADAVHLMDNGSPGNYQSDTYALEHLKISTIVGQGRYGCVFKGTLLDKEVAVKIFPGHHRQYFHNERDIYCLPFMDNPALLTYFGSDERVSAEGYIDYLLVLSYATNGCLQDYLRSNLVDWNCLCRMALSVAKGLAHLHTDIRKGDKFKPCVTHRDLNSRNILVKADLSCCLCDLGFAMKISGSKYFYNGEEQHAETKSINDVGTLRYMAPEVLEGAVNLRDCESSLKQIDVYALGLVLWEIATRCADLYQLGTSVPPYSMPFEAEVGHHPTFEQMQVLVSRHKARPLFPEGWRDWAAVRLLRETIEDCWDQDAEARLTALCVEERIQELPSLWDRMRAITTSGMSPTVNPTVNPTFTSTTLSQLPGVVRTTNNNNNSSSGTNTNYNYNNNSSNMGHMISSGLHEKQLPDSLENTDYSVKSGSGTCGKDACESNLSEGTIETTVTISPSDSHAESSYKNSNQTFVPPGGTHTFPLSSGLTSSVQHQRASLQPYQGRNPCMERNLMLTAPSDEDLACNGNTLVDRSFKHASASNYLINTALYEPQALVSHDYLSTSQLTAGNNSIRPATPIPYVQNAVYDTNSTCTGIPKQPNIPGNGSAVVDGVTHTKSSHWSNWGKGSSRWEGFKKYLDSKTKSLFGMSKEREAHTVDSGNTVVKEFDEVDDDVKSNLLARQTSVTVAPLSKRSPVLMETKVCVSPPDKLVNGVSTNTGVVTSVMSPLISTTNRNDNENKDSKVTKSQRPCTLALTPAKPTMVCEDTSVAVSRQNLKEQIHQVFRNRSNENASRLKDPNLRVKTPGDVPPSVRRNRGKGGTARFSLYDDRMMITKEFSKTSCANTDLKTNSSQIFSSSVPTNIDISCSSEILEKVVPYSSQNDRKLKLRSNDACSC